MTAVIDSYTYELLATPQFARIVDSTGADEGRGVVTDSDENVYIAGFYSGSPIIKNQSGTSLGTLPASAGGTAAFVCKFDSSGTYQYSRIVDGAGTDVGYSVACDSSGNMYLAGQYRNIPTIKNQSGTSLGTLPATAGFGVAFVCKFDSSGTYQYSRIVDSSSGEEYGYSVTCDSTGNMYLSGSYDGTPTIKAVNSSNVSTNIGTLPASVGGSVAFVCKFDSSGTYQYSRIVDSGGNDNGYSVTCDSTGNMYLSGSYDGTPTIKAVNSSNVSTNIGTLPASAGGAAFFCKFDSSGTYQYSRIVDTTSSEIGYSVTCDSSGNMYLAGQNGSASGTTPIKDQSGTTLGTLPATPGGAAFVCKFDSSGTYQYSRIVDGEAGGDVGYSVTCDSSGNMYVSGRYTAGTTTIKAVNSSNVSTNIGTLPASAGTFDFAAFVCKFDSSGNYQYSRIVDSGGNDIGYSVTCDSTGNMYLAGTYNLTPTIKAVNSSNVSTNIGTLPASAGSSVAFLVKFDPDGNYAP
jgi:uncharacterized protein (DUF2147 family)